MMCKAERRDMPNVGGGRWQRNELSKRAEGWVDPFGVKDGSPVLSGALSMVRTHRNMNVNSGFERHLPRPVAC